MKRNRNYTELSPRAPPKCIREEKFSSRETFTKLYNTNMNGRGAPLRARAGDQKGQNSEILKIIKKHNKQLLNDIVTPSKKIKNFTLKKDLTKTNNVNDE